MKGRRGGQAGKGEGREGQEKGRSALLDFHKRGTTGYHGKKAGGGSIAGALQGKEGKRGTKGGR